MPATGGGEPQNERVQLARQLNTAHTLYLRNGMYNEYAHPVGIERVDAMRTDSLYYTLVSRTSDLIKLWKLCSVGQTRISCMFLQSPTKGRTL